MRKKCWENKRIELQGTIFDLGLTMRRGCTGYFDFLLGPKNRKLSMNKYVRIYAAIFSFLGVRLTKIDEPKFFKWLFSCNIDSKKANDSLHHFKLKQIFLNNMSSPSVHGWSHATILWNDGKWFHWFKLCYCVTYSWT